MLDSYRLRRRGFNTLGEGMAAVVLAKPGSNRVVKICTKPDSWPAFILWAQQQNSPFAPKLHSFKQYESGNYVAIIERLPLIGPIDDQTRYLMNSLCRGDYATTKEDHPRYPGLIPFLQRLQADIGYDDLHNENYGHRADGSLVIFDPISPYCQTSTSSTIKRYKSCTPTDY